MCNLIGLGIEPHIYRTDVTTTLTTGRLNKNQTCASFCQQINQRAQGAHLQQQKMQCNFGCI